MPLSANTWLGTDATPAFDVVILDYDGTLSDTRGAIAHCLERAFAEHGRSVPQRGTAADVIGRGLSLPETCLLLDRDLSKDRVVLEEIVTTYRTLYGSEAEPLIKIFPGARKALQRIHDCGAKCVVVSNKGFAAVHRSLDRLELMPFIDHVLADQPGMPLKPDPALLTDHILSKYPHIPKRQILMVGDTEIDIQFAKTTGIASCWAAYGFGDQHRCRELEPEYRIDGIAELPALICTQARPVIP